MTSTFSIKRTALGRIRQFAALYDARRDDFVSGYLFSTPLESQILDAPYCDFSFSFEDSKVDKFKKLDISAELKISVLAGLFSLEGSGKYFSDEKTTINSTKATFKYKYISKSEEFNPFSHGLIIEPVHFSNGEATHFVERIKWGACAYIAIEAKSSDATENERIEGLLKLNFDKKAFQIQGKADVQFDRNDLTTSKMFNIRVYGDVPPPEKTPDTIEEALVYIKSIPSLIQNINGGKGVPIEYDLCPMTALQDKVSCKAAKLCATIDSQQLISVEKIFDEYDKAKLKLSSLEELFEGAKEVVSSELLAELKNHSLNLRSKEADFKDKAMKEIIKIRSGENSIGLSELLRVSIEDQTLTDSDLYTNKTFREVGGKFDLFSFYKSLGVRLLPVNYDYTNLINKSEKEKVFVLFYLEDKQDKTENRSRNITLFRNLIDEEKKTDFIIVDLSIHEHLKKAFNQSCIHFFLKRKLISKDYAASFDELKNFIVFEEGHKRTTLKEPAVSKLFKVSCPKSIEYGRCLGSKQSWTCAKCLNVIYIDEQMNLHCRCFFASFRTAKFRCSDPKHGDDYTTHFDEEKIKSELKNMVSTHVFYPNQDIYYGELSYKDLKHGKGSYTWEDGYIFEGQWEEDQRSGDGEFIWPNGLRYKGKWEDGCVVNGGVFVFPNGQRCQVAWGSEPLFVGLGNNPLTKSDIGILKTIQTENNRVDNSVEARVDKPLAQAQMKDGYMGDSRPLVYGKPKKPTLVFKYIVERPLGVIMGKTRVGKTTLLNNLCGTNEEAGASEASVTRRLFKSTTNTGASFDLIDTPGIDSKVETYKHVLLVKEGLTALPINTIFIVLKYDSRFGNILGALLKVQEAVYKYESKVVVMISHWDQSKNPTSDFQKIGKMLEEYCAGVIFYSEQSSFNEVSQLMSQFLCSMEKTQLKVEEEDFFTTFNVYEIRNEMKKSYLSFQKDLQNLEKSFDKLIKEAKDNLDRVKTTGKSEEYAQALSEFDDLLHCLIVTFREEIDDALESFINKHRDNCESLENYTFYIKMQKESVRRNSFFSDKASQLMSYNLNDNQDPRNLIKKCPNCGLVWMKTEGCDGTTTCGKRVSSFCDILSRPFKKFKFTRQQDGSFTYTKTVAQPIQKPTKSTRANAAGCQQLFCWKDQPPLDQKIIAEIFQAKDFEEVKKLLQDKQFQKFKKEYDADIDTKIYTSSKDYKFGII